jgi:cytochrome subunit of sulfide dehydrogenase
MSAMRLLIAALAAAPLAAGSSPASPAGAAEAPPGATSCSGCHAGSAGVETPVPRLVGRSASELVSQMEAFRSGQRQATVMDKIAKGFSDAEIQAIAAWYAEQR